jgi:hypothetical protein
MTIDESRLAFLESIVTPGTTVRLRDVVWPDGLGFPNFAAAYDWCGEHWNRHVREMREAGTWPS